MQSFRRELRTGEFASSTRFDLVTEDKVGQCQRFNKVNSKLNTENSQEKTSLITGVPYARFASTNEITFFGPPVPFSSDYFFRVQSNFSVDRIIHSKRDMPTSCSQGRQLNSVAVLWVRTATKSRWVSEVCIDIVCCRLSSIESTLEELRAVNRPPSSHWD